MEHTYIIFGRIPRLKWMVERATPRWCVDMMDPIAQVDRASVEIALEGYRVNWLEP